ncbi:hypothetical protein GCM10011583_36430 [Streptomyces camponoticapitis]|uniref:Uncharacterized protein n=1 Tax=Streptomyces camponoticapitis TaxID=1616125 RepID=A0ABQ2EBP5_9ACTN|nr:hypothetical protein GCM10011583_36430 [Streptomyces camponoticapitis]
MPGRIAVDRTPRREPFHRERERHAAQGVADRHLRPGGQRLHQIVGEVLRRVSPLATGAVAAQIDGDHAQSARGQFGPHPSPRAVVGHDAVDQERDAVALAPGVGVQSQDDPFRT